MDKTIEDAIDTALALFTQDIPDLIALIISITIFPLRLIAAFFEPAP